MDVAIVEAGIEEDVGGDVLRHLQLEGVLPLHLAAVVGGEAPEAALPGDGLGELPDEVGGELRTGVEQVVLAVVDAVTGGEPGEIGRRGGVLLGEQLATDVAVVEGDGRDVDGAGQLLVEGLHLVVHTETDVEVERREEVGNF